MSHDLIIENGHAWQRSMDPIEYDELYFNKCLSYEDQPIALEINAGRIAFVEDYLKNIPYRPGQEVLDIGVGSGEFIKKRPNTYGYDINPVSVQWLKEAGKYRDDFESFSVFTFWDVIEHVPDPNVYFSRIPGISLLFASIPVFKDLNRVRESKHYRPNEHLHYFTEEGFIQWMYDYGFRHQETRRFEINAGREDILSFCFKKRL